jgi:hypothetical protein
MNKLTESEIRTLIKRLIETRLFATNKAQWMVFFRQTMRGRLLDEF